MDEKNTLLPPAGSGEKELVKLSFKGEEKMAFSNVSPWWWMLIMESLYLSGGKGYIIWEISVPSLSFCCERETDLKSAISQKDTQS